VDQAIVRPRDRNPASSAHAGDALDVVERLAAFHPEAVDHKKFLGVMCPSAQRRRERVVVSEIDPHAPPGPVLDVLVRLEVPHQALDREREHPGNAKLRNAVNAGLALVREIALFELCPPLRGDVLGVARLNPGIAAIRRILVEEAVGERATAFERGVAQEYDAIGRSRAS
jgi:hypothetical protein